MRLAVWLANQTAGQLVEHWAEQSVERWVGLLAVWKVDPMVVRSADEKAEKWVASTAALLAD